MRQSLVACVVITLASGAALAQGPSGAQQPGGKPAQAQGAKPGQAAGAQQQHGHAGAQQAGQPPAGGMDMSKMGPWTRKPKNEAAVRKEIQAFFREEEALMKKGDFEGSVARHDFPIYMMTDDSKGMPMGQVYERDAFVAEMKPFWDNMPKDLRYTHKPTITVLSDSLVSVTDDFTMHQGKQSLRGRNATILVKRDGKWMWKAMTEAGWGDMSSQGSAPGSK